MNKEIKQKTISLSVNWIRDEYLKYTVFTLLVPNALKQQADYYFGKANWYAKAFSVKREAGTIIYSMDVEGM